VPRSKILSLLLEGKRAFITGGTRGIGAALCEVFAREGADVAFNYGSRDDLAEEIRGKIEAQGRRAHSAKVSVTDRFGMKHLTRELVQDLFLWIWRHRHQWDVHSGLTTYLYRSARNRAVSHVRHERLQRRWREEQERNGAFAIDGAEPPRSDEAIRVAELSHAIESAIASLPQRCREVFILNREHGLTYREVAETLDISVKTVEVHMGRALSVLRLRLSDWIS